MLAAGFLGIDIGYYLHLGVGQWKLIWNQRPIDEVIADEATDPDIRYQLLLAKQIRAYAIDTLGLEGSDNYTTYCEIGDRPVVWVLSVAPADALEPHRWSYPVIGSAPYRGFFVRSRGEAELDKFEQRGYDTHLRGVSAFSTIGWFRDPILTPMLKYRAIDLADVLIHELLHASIWIEGDADFNESLATFVGREGAKRWALEFLEGGADSLAARDDLRKDRVAYGDLLHGLATRLDSVYSLDVSREEKLAAKAHQIETTRKISGKRAWLTKGYDTPEDWTINNATLALFRTYNKETDIFERVLLATGELRQAIAVFEMCEEELEPEAFLERWLEQNASSK
ncbi:MAG: hypothetical protein CME21_17115 [Gemmatimonadetes bacterium]|jgi:predicted aminopeptidase|nr:hypothetical protein [Gemmatimonadota bacterium]